MSLRQSPAVILLLAVTACTAGTPGTGSPSPTRTPSPPAAGLGTKVPGSTVALGPATEQVRDCPGCVVRGHRDAVRPGISIALLTAAAAGTRQRAVLVAYRTSSGAVLGQLTVPDADRVDARTPECDSSPHCFVPGSAGAHGGTLAAIAVAPTGTLSVTASLTASLTASQPTFSTPDPDGDGVREIAAVQDDCDPSCAAGTRYWQVWRLAGERYTDAGCAPYAAADTRPPAALDPARCPH